MNLTNPIRILTLRANPTQLNLILDPEGPTWKWVGFKSGLLSIYIIGLNPNLNPFWGQPDLIGPILDSEGQPDHFEPENRAQTQVKPKRTGTKL